MTFDRERPLFRYFALPEDGGPGWFEVGADNRPMKESVHPLVDKAIQRFVSHADWDREFLAALQEHKKATIYYGADSQYLADEIRETFALSKRSPSPDRLMPYFYYNDGARQAGAGAPKRSPAEVAAFGYEIVGANGQPKHVLDATRDELLASIVNLTDCMEAVHHVGIRLSKIERSYTTGDAMEDGLEQGN